MTEGESGGWRQQGRMAGEDRGVERAKLKRHYANKGDDDSARKSFSFVCGCGCT